MPVIARPPHMELIIQRISCWSFEKVGWLVENVSRQGFHLKRASHSLEISILLSVATFIFSWRPRRGTVFQICNACGASACFQPPEWRNAPAWTRIAFEHDIILRLRGRTIYRELRPVSSREIRVRRISWNVLWEIQLLVRADTEINSSFRYGEKIKSAEGLVDDCSAKC